ncbi:MAG: hypothetical protein ACLSEX_07645 [Blautia sp.]
MKKTNRRGMLMALPLYLFTIIFVAGPLIYMVALSFATNNESYGVTWRWTLENYGRILESTCRPLKSSNWLCVR